MARHLPYNNPLAAYLRAVRGGRRPKDAFKFVNMRDGFGFYSRDRTVWISVGRRADGVYLGHLEKELGRFVAYPNGRKRPIGSYLTRNDAAIALEGAHALPSHRKSVKAREEQRRLYRDRTSDAREARAMAGP